MPELNRRALLRRSALSSVRGALLLLAGALVALPFRARADFPLERIDSLRVAYRGREALAAIEAALPQGEAAGDTALILALHLRQGELLASYGDARAAEEVLRGTLAIAWTRRDTLTACQCMRWLALAVGSEGRYAECDSLSRTLLRTARKIHAVQHQGWARVGLGWSAWTRGSIEEALENYREATLLFRRAEHPRGEAWALHGLGAALSGAGRIDEARRRYQDVIAVAQRIGDPMIACLANNNLGALEHARGDPGAALIYYRSAERLLRQIGNPREAMEPALNIVTCEIDLGRYQAAVDSLEHLVSFCQAQGYEDLEARVQNSLALVRERQGRVRESRARYRASLALGPQVPLEDRVASVTGLSDSFEEPDSLDAAVTLLTKTLANLPSSCPSPLRSALLTSLGDARLRGGALDLSLAPLTQAIAWHPTLRATTLLGRSLLALGRRDDARAAFERALLLWEETRDVPEDPEWREARAAEQRVLFSELAWILADRSPEQAYAVVQRYKARTLMERMCGPSRRSGFSDSIPDLEQLQRSLADGELLLDYCLGANHSHLFVVSRGAFRHVDLPPESALAGRIVLFRDLLARPPATPDDAALLTPIAAALRAALLPDLEDIITASRRVFVALDGSLHLVPFASLFPDASVEWVRAPSAAIVVRQRQSAGDPVARGRSLAVAGMNGGTLLRGALSETADLARRNFQVERRVLGARDSLTSAEMEAPWAVLHLATHATADGERPWLSTLAIGARDVTAESIARGRVRARLAVLSSCQSAHGRVAPGEGMLGLSTALLAAGADCVVATLWPVDDRTTADFMRAFYRDLGAGSTVAQALGGARRALLRDPATAHPYFWAGFVALGAGDLRIEMLPASRAPARTTLAAIGAVVVLLVLGLTARRQARRRVTAEGGGRLMG